MAQTTEPTQPESFEGRTRLAHRTELANRRKAAETWEPIWAEAGIKLAHHAIADHPDLRIRPSDPMGLIHGLEPGRIGHDDLVSVRDQGTPDDLNQHLRRVVTTLPAPDGSGRITALLGEAVPREKWPLAMMRKTTPVALEVSVRGDTVLVSRGVMPVSEIHASERDVGVWKGYVEAMLASAARAGKHDGLTGHDYGLSVVKGKSGSGSRVWEIRDDRGRLYASDSRRPLQRTAPQRIEQLLHAVRTAYGHAFDQAKFEDRLVTDASNFHGGEPDGPGESEAEVRSYGGP